MRHLKPALVFLPLFVLVILINWGLVAQQPLPPPLIPDLNPRYQANLVSTSGSGAVTIQQAAFGQKAAACEVITLYASAANNFLLSQNGAGATTTALTISKLNLSPPPTINAFTASNVGTGAFVSNAYYVSAGSTFVIDCSRMYLTQNGGINQNITVSWPAVGSYSGTTEVSIEWIEKP